MTKKKPGRKKYHISPEEFVRIYTESTCLQEVHEKTGMPIPIINARVSSYRKKGINLKIMKRANSRRLDVEALDAIIAKYAPSEKETPPIVSVQLKSQEEQQLSKKERKSVSK